MATVNVNTAYYTYSVITNIPHSYHSRDLRNFFSQFIETHGFECFHFRHRPEVSVIIRCAVTNNNTDTVTDTDTDTDTAHPVPAAGTGSAENQLTRSIGSSSARGNYVAGAKSEAEDRKSSRSVGTTCCVVKLKTDRIDEFIHTYHRKHWLDRKGNCLPTLCITSKIKISGHGECDTSRYKTKHERQNVPEDRVHFTRADLLQLLELRPPAIMPHGNVGTPTAMFLEMIAACKLPSGVIQKLGLTFPKCRSKRRYGDVHYDYGGVTDDAVEAEEMTVRSAQGHVLQSDSDYQDLGDSADMTAPPSPSTNAEDEKPATQSDEDDDTCEDWERHEALTDDADGKERNKERLFECEMEVVWEKGGSGLVFYTDAQYWDAQQGDFDERTTDDWDVDMSTYYDPNGGDKDAKDMLAMRQEKRRRNGEDDTDIRNGIGQFEMFTKGIGRRVLERQGWQDGRGLGSTQSGRADALDNEGQTAKDKRGLGYVGEKLQRFGMVKKRKKGAIISTVYDDVEETDPAELLLRRNEPYGLKHRPSHIRFMKASLRPSDIL